jgi:hypothetical protein
MQKEMHAKILNGTMQKMNAATHRLTVAVMVLFTLFVTSSAFNQEIADALRVSRQGLHFNARALGLGNAYSTIGYDFSALGFNPATMALNNKASYTVTMNTNAFKSDADYYGANINFTTTSTTGSQTGVTVPLRLDSTRNVILGLGYTQSKDYNLGYQYEGFNGGSPSFVEALADKNDLLARSLGLSYATYDSSGNFVGDQTILGSNMYEKGYLLNEGGMFNFSVGASVEAVNNVFFGVSGNYNISPFNSDLELTASDINDVYPVGVSTIPGNSETDGFINTNYRVVRSKQYKGWDIRFGILYKLENFIGLSASFKTPTSHSVNEEVFISGSSQFASDRSLVVPETKFTSSYSFSPPSEMTLGAMVNLWILTGTAQASYVDYADMKITGGVGDLPDRTAINKRIKDELSAVLNLNAGLEFRLPFTGLCARAGAIYQPSPYKDDPSRYSQKFLTAGFGINSNNIMQFDMAYAYGWRGEHKSQQEVSDSGAEQQIAYHSVLFTMRFAP